MNPINRRKFLTFAGGSFALPSLEIFAKTQANPANKNLVCMGTWLGLHTPSFIPKQSGKNYEPSRLLKIVDRHRKHYSIFSGLDHDVSHGHKSWNNFLCATEGNTVSIDQVIANKTKANTRLSSLEITCGRVPAEAKMNVTASGVGLPMINRPSTLFNKLFPSAHGIARKKYELESSGSILDDLLAEASQFNQTLGIRDKRKMDEYFTSIREVEKEVFKERKWLDRSLPKSDYKLPKIDPIAPQELFQCEKIMFDLIALALESGSTQVCSYLAPGGGVFEFENRLLSASYHGLSHHGNNPKALREFIQVNEAHMKNLNHFLSQLKDKKDGQDVSLLDKTMVYFGSGLGDANIHSTHNVPVLVAGGGFKHGKHVSFDKKAKNNPLLGGLFLTFLEQFGIQQKSFGKATSNLNSYLV